jgi:hypothetical protein
MATITLRTIKLLLDTNIPGSQIVPLTKSVLYQAKMDTSKWNDLPWFTMDAEFPEGYLSTLTYEQQMEFFFNRKRMGEILRTRSSVFAPQKQGVLGLTSKRPATAKIDDKEEAIQNIREQEEVSLIKLDEQYEGLVDELKKRTTLELRKKYTDFQNKYNTSGGVITRTRSKSQNKFPTLPRFPDDIDIDDDDTFEKFRSGLLSIFKGIKTGVKLIETLENVRNKYIKNKDKIKGEYETQKEEVVSTAQEEIDKVNAAPVTSTAVSTAPVTRLDIEGERNRIGEVNIMIMIRLMFPTKYPIIGNIFSSFNAVITQQTEFNVKWTDFIPGFFKKQVFEGLRDYSYLKINGGIYTVTQAIWLNDIYNHKEYRQLIFKFEQLQQWKEKEIEKTEIELVKKFTLFKETYRANDSNFKLTQQDIDNIEKLEILKKPGVASGSGGIGNVGLAKQTAFISVAKTLIKALGKLLEAIQNEQKNDEQIIESAKIVTKYMSELLSRDNFQYLTGNFPSARYERIVDKMKKDLDIIEADRYILDIYLRRPGINMDYESDKYKGVIDRKYSTYSRFVENIRTFRAPVLESTNIDLQNTIEEFLNNTEKLPGVFNFMMTFMNFNKNPFEIVNKKTAIVTGDFRDYALNYQKRLKTGITIRPSASETDPYYEVYVQVNVIGGELNDDNKSTIDCLYNGESLGDRLERLLNESLSLPWMINNSRIFFDITTGEAKSQIDKQERERKEKEEREKAKAALASGSASTSASGSASTSESTSAMGSASTSASTSALGSASTLASGSKKKGGSTRNFREWVMKTQKRYPIL